jgi:hypothetical protein
MSGEVILEKGGDYLLIFESSILTESNLGAPADITVSWNVFTIGAAPE